MWGLKRKNKERDPEKEFRLAVGLLISEKCVGRTECKGCMFNRDDIECVTLMGECGV